MNAVAELPRATAVAAASAPTSELDRLLRQDFSPRDMMMGDGFERMLRMAEIMASGKTTIPKHLQGNVGDCMAVITQAMQWNFNPFAVAQKTHLVNGTLGYEAQLVIAALNASPLLATRINWRWADNWAGLKGKDDASQDHWVDAWSTLRGEREPRLLRVTMAQVGGVRNSPNWATDARQQLAYLASKRWGRLHAPDVILGVYTPDELQYGTGDDAAALPPAPAAAPPAPEVWPDESFRARLPRWQEAVNAGKAVDEIVSFARSKGALTAEQEAKLRDLKPAVKAAPAPTAPDADAQADAAGSNDDFVRDMERADGAPQ